MSHLWMRRQARRAFTLVELMVVMVLMAIVGAVVIPAFLKSAVVDPTSQATQPIVQLLKFGKQQSVELGTSVRVMLDPATGAYSVIANSVDTALAEGRLELPASTRILADSLRLRFLFEPSGVTFADSLIVSSSQGAALIRVNAWTGVVNVVR
jgi:prepilin-type N-terminal cleavage/methylation domain-containing protein